MPRNGSGVYSLPPGTDDFQPGTTIESTKIDSLSGDLEADANTARPIVAGGTGAGTAIAAHDNIRSNGADIASAATVNLDNATGVLLDITGTTTTTAITLAQGKERIVRCAGAWPITAGASLIISNATSGTFTFQAGDLLHILGYASGVVRVNKINGGAGIDDNATSSALTIVTNGYVGVGTNAPSFLLDANGSIGMTEKAAADPDVAGKGQLWIKNDTPNVFMFTDDAGIDHRVSGVSGAPSAVLEDQKTSGTHAGASVAASWTVRDLNTIVRDPDSLVGLSGNSFTPTVSGWVEWTVPCIDSDYYQSRIYNVTDSIVVGYSASNRVFGTDTNHSCGGQAVVGGKTYRIEHIVSTSKAINGFGNASSFGTEIYTRVKFWRT